MNFTELPLSSAIQKALVDKKYTQATPIQKQAIPLVLDGHDVLGCAQTGTGKTAAFAIPLLAGMESEGVSKKISCLILTPTRELAIQIGESFTDYGKYLGIRNTVIFGGVNQSPQVRAIKSRPEVLIATPGRLLDLIGQGLLSLKDINRFVLDEADRMLDMGFIHDINKVLELLPKKRQSLFFSATMPDKILSLSQKILHRPKRVTVAPVSSTAETIQQKIFFTNKSDKKHVLLHLLENKDLEQVLVFSRTKHGADRIVKHLKKKKIESAAIHGDKSQPQRQKALNAFKSGVIRVLVATDIAARGIDIEKLQYVINYDIPNEPETYVHRIGRCGRAGESGISISISEPEENTYVKSIEKLTKCKIEVVENHPFPQTEKPMNAEEKKAFEKEKVERRKAYFANKKKRNDGPKGGGSKRQGHGKPKRR